MLGLSSADAIASVVNILSTWPIPEGTPGVYLASGTVQTCTAQGFFNELGNVATPLYNASLCVYFARKIRDGRSEDEVQYNDERRMHFIPMSVAFTIAVLGLILDLYNNSGWLCWFAENPFGCASNPDVECIRGQLAEPFRWAHYAIIWSAICFIGYEMYSIYNFVRAYERAEADDEDGMYRGTKAKKVAIQAGLFVGALYLTWFFTTVRSYCAVALLHMNFRDPYIIYSHTCDFFQGDTNLPECYRAQQFYTAGAHGHLLPIARLLQLSHLHKATIFASEITEPSVHIQAALLHCSASRCPPNPQYYHKTIGGQC